MPSCLHSLGRRTQKSDGLPHGPAQPGQRTLQRDFAASVPTLPVDPLTGPTEGFLMDVEGQSLDLSTKAEVLSRK